MSYTAPNRLLMPARHSIGFGEPWMQPAVGFGTSAAAWPTANLAIYVPVGVPARVVVRKLWFASATTGTGNVDMGLYDASGVAVISATNAAKIASTNEQVFDVTDTTIGPGLYYVALSSDSATDTFYRTAPAAPIATAIGVLVETSAYPLPATATWVVDQALAYVPLMGLLLEGTVA